MTCTSSRSLWLLVLLVLLCLIWAVWGLYRDVYRPVAVVVPVGAARPADSVTEPVLMWRETVWVESPGGQRVPVRGGWRPAPAGAQTSPIFDVLDRPRVSR
jgi:hypothetical protein